MLAIFRNYPDQDLARIGEAHLQSDLSSSDRARLKRAASKVSTHVSIGSLIGLGLSAALAWRIRSNRMALHQAFKLVSRPTELVFANGRREPLPDLEPFIRPTGWADAATYTAFGLGGVLLGGELGLLTGTASASRTIAQDPESRQRIEEAFRKFQVDVLRREIDMLEGNDKKSPSFSWDRMKDQAAGMVDNLKG